MLHLFVLQFVAVCWSVLQCVVVCCSALLCAALYYLAAKSGFFNASKRRDIAWNNAFVHAHHSILNPLFCCSVLSCVVVCVSVLQCVSVWYSLLQCVAVCRNVFQNVELCNTSAHHPVFQPVCCLVRCSVCQCVAVSSSVLQCVAVWCNVFLCVSVLDIVPSSRIPTPFLLGEVWCRVLQCDTVWCSALQCVAVSRTPAPVLLGFMVYVVWLRLREIDLIRASQSLL